LPDVSRSSPITAWCADEGEAAPVLQALAAHRDLAQLQALPDPSFPRDNEGQLLLLPVAPAIALCRAMEAGTGPAQALAEWQAETRTILALVRRDRRHTRVLDVEAARAWPAAFRAAFGLPEGQELEPLRRNSREDLLLLALAQLLLLGDPKSRRLLAELEGASVNLTGNAPSDPIEPEEVYRAWLQSRETVEALRARIAELEDSESQNEQRHRTSQKAIDLLQDQARWLQEELETVVRRETELKAEAAAVPVLRQRVDEKERSLLATGDMLHRLDAERAAARAEAERLEARLAESEAELRHVYGSRSFRLTAPLRRLRAALAGRGSA
jgi:hypothetical protein